MYHVKKLGIQWVVVLRNFDGVDRIFGYFARQSFAETAAEAMNTCVANRLL